MTTVPIQACAWRKSSQSSSNDTCVEVHQHLDAVRDTKHSGPVLAADVPALIAAVKAGRIGR